jgi:gluconolactonase
MAAMRGVAWLALLVLAGCGATATQHGATACEPMQGVLVVASDEPATLRPFASVDLATDEGVALAGAGWRYVAATIDHVESPTPGADLRPSGPPGPTLDVTPRPGRDGFDDAAWEPIAPSSLSARRGGGHFSMGWYRTEITLPSALGDRAIDGASVTLEVVADDYGEVWIDGRSPRRVGLRGETVVAGFNAPNRVRLTDHARAGQHFEIAIFVMNGPVSVSPPNFHWLRSVVLDVADPPPPPPIVGAIEGGPLGASHARGLERVATGFGALAGLAAQADGTVLLADAERAVVHRYEPGVRIAPFRTHAGYVGLDPRAMERPGPTDVVVTDDERVIYAEPAARRVTRSERTGALVVVAQDLLGPRALALASDGSLFVADAGDDGAGRLLRVDARGEITVLAEGLDAPRGLALASDGALYVADARGVRRFADGALGSPLVTDAASDVAIDRDGALYVATERGVVVLDAAGARRGALLTPAPARGLALGGGWLYVALPHDLLRAQLLSPP